MSSDVNAGFDEVIAAVRDRLSRNLRIRRALPGGGRLRLDRQLPFLCVHRSPQDAPDLGTRELVTTEAAYLFASGDPALASGLAQLCTSIRETLQEHFGTVLFIEIWAEEPSAERAANRPGSPKFRLLHGGCDPLQSTVFAFQGALRAIRLHGENAEVEVAPTQQLHAPGLTPLNSSENHFGCQWIGLGVQPIYRDARGQTIYPVVLQSLRRQLAIAIRKTVFAFTGRGEAKARKPLAHYESLGPSAMSRAARETDQQLSAISQSFDFLLQATPVNSETAWEEFKASSYGRLPTLYYRPLPYNPTLLNRQLYAAPIEYIEDATLAHIFDEKQDELGKQIGALKTIGTSGFFYDSLKIYGKPDDALAQLADDILAKTAETVDSSSALASAEQIIAAARNHFDYYHQRLPSFNAKVQLVTGIAATLMVAHDQLLVSETAAIRQDRLEPLLHHEIGTHLLTYFNGQQQPLRQLYAGFAGYEALQEGLAVLAEYLVGGLSTSRIRTLAARVAAVAAMIEGASFAETFDLLHRQRGIPSKNAFMTTLRVYRGGGLTKDSLYLKGLSDLLAYLRNGHDLEPLYVGKISLQRVPAVRELRRRGLVQPPVLLPRFWQEESHLARLEKCRQLSLLELLET